MKAGYAIRNITPPMGLEMCGYGYYLGRVANSLHDPLFARALYLEQGDGRFLLISCDLEGISVQTCDEVKKHVESSTGLKLQEVMIHCTHTHSGPACVKTRGCGKMDKGYVDQLKKKLVELAVEALERAQEVESVAFGSSRAANLAFNRVYGEAGAMDESVRVVLVKTWQDQPYLIVNYACHPVCCGVNSEISADFPGITVKLLLESGYKAIFVTGFCGDIDPPRDRGYELVEKTGRAVADAALEAVVNAKVLGNPQIRTSLNVAKVKKNCTDKEELMQHIRDARDTLECNPADGHALCKLSWAVDTLDVVECKDVDAPLQVVALGDICLAGCPGETFTAFGETLRKNFPTKHILTVNEANGVIGYIPTADEFDNNGYSVTESGRIYGEHLFTKGFGEKLCDELAALVNKVFK